MGLSVYLYRTLNCPHCGGSLRTEEEVFEANITHNLTLMADKADVYYAIWRPEEKEYVRAGQLIEPLASGLARLKDNPGYFTQFEAKNGWGLYKHFVPWVEAYLEACSANPEAIIRVYR